MKLDIDCIRDIIIAVSNNLVPDSYGYVEPVKPLGLAQSYLTQYPTNEVLYWIRQLMDSQIIIPGAKYVDEPLPYIDDLSISGYQFINATEENSIWKKVKPKLLSVTISSVSVLIQSAIELGISCIV